LAVLGAIEALFAPLSPGQGNGASLPLVHFREPFCDGTPLAPGITQNGTATIKETGNGILIAEVALKGALPNTDYNVRLIQTPSGADCFTIDGVITTNGQGNGTITIKEAALPGTTGAFAFVDLASELDFYSTSNHLFR
jgi:hypothetical protein